MSIIVFDTETTDFLAPEIAGAARQPHMIEFACIKLNGELQEVDRLVILMNPKVPIPEAATKVHGYTDETVKSLKPFAAFWKQIATFFIGSTHAVGHNLLFDKNIVHWELIRIGKQMNFPWPPGAICTVEAIQKIKGHRMNLMDLYVELMGETFTGAHSANADVEATMKVFVRMVEKEMIKL